MDVADTEVSIEDLYDVYFAKDGKSLQKPVNTQMKITGILFKNA